MKSNRTQTAQTHEDDIPTTSAGLVGEDLRTQGTVRWRGETVPAPRGISTLAAHSARS